MTIDDLYWTLRAMISDANSIKIIDSEQYLNGATVTICRKNNSYHWTTFRGKTIEDALRKAIDKFEHPEKDYVEDDGHVWKASESSCYSENHIKSFLRC